MKVKDFPADTSPSGHGQRLQRPASPRALHTAAVPQQLGCGTALGEAPAPPASPLALPQTQFSQSL